MNPFERHYRIRYKQVKNKIRLFFKLGGSYSKKMVLLRTHEPLTS